MANGDALESSSAGVVGNSGTLADAEVHIKLVTLLRSAPGGVLVTDAGCP